jgi:flagellar hook-associated protein 3 FlgL
MAISTRVYNDQAMSTLNRITGDIQNIQSKIATGRNILKASDDPAISTKISFTKDQKVMLERYNANINMSKNRLEQAETAMGTSVNILQRIYELTIQARNDTNNLADRQSIGLEVKNLRDQMLSLANTRDANGQYIFAGYKVETQPYLEDKTTGKVVHHGDSGVHTLQISRNQRIPTSLNGADVFLRVPHDKGVENMFSMLDDIVAKLELGKMDDDFIDKMDSSVRHFSLQQTKIGATINRSDMQKEVNDRQLLLMDQDISNLEDADIAKLVTDLQAKLVSRNAAQQAFVKIAQDNLFNYLR